MPTEDHRCPDFTRCSGFIGLSKIKEGNLQWLANIYHLFNDVYSITFSYSLGAGRVMVL